MSGISHVLLVQNKSNKKPAHGMAKVEIKNEKMPTFVEINFA